jgi:hypothetical protein
MPLPPNDPKTNPQNGRGQPLPKKEYDMFKNVVKQYEHKQYKKAVKLADTILKKFPNHGETLAMKGLSLNYLSKREEAHSLVKLGLTNDMKYVQNQTRNLDEERIKSLQSFIRPLHL